MEVDGKAQIADPLTAMLHNPGTDLRSQSAAGRVMESTVILLSPQFVATLYETSLFGRSEGFAADNLRLEPADALALFSAVRAASEADHSLLQMEEAVINLLHGLNAQSHLGAGVDDGFTKSSKAHGKLAATAKELVSHKYAEQLALPELGRELGASPFHLSRVFKQHTGLSLHQYRTRVRLNAALHRLLDGQQDLTELALELGFSSHSHFSTAFRKEFGKAPREARAGFRETLPA